MGKKKAKSDQTDEISQRLRRHISHLSNLSFFCRCVRFANVKMERRYKNFVLHDLTRF